MNLETYIRDFPGFPKPGVLFKDITPILRDKNAFSEMIEAFTLLLKVQAIDCVVAIEARGYLLGAPVAYALGCGIVPIRKEGKLPGPTYRIEYSLEYGAEIMEIQQDALKPGERVCIIDDVLATGGTLLGATQLVHTLGASIVSIAVLLEITNLFGRSNLSDYRIDSLIRN